MIQMASITSVAFLAMASATMIAGWISDRWIASGGTPTRVRKTVVVFGLTCSTVILPVAIVKDANVSLCLLILACMAFGSYTSNHWAITQTLSGPMAAGRWTSIQNGVGNLSGIVASWLTGFIVDRTHSFAAAFIVAACVVLAGALFWGTCVGAVEEVEWERSAVAG